jgi:hypothetical protein
MGRTGAAASGTVSAANRVRYRDRMRRATAIMLVLMGGGTMILSPFLSRPSQACNDARAAHQPDADEICEPSHSGSHGSWHGSWFSGSGSSGTNSTHAAASTTASSTSVARGGFGGTGAHMASAG